MYEGCASAELQHMVVFADLFGLRRSSWSDTTEELRVVWADGGDAWPSAEARRFREAMRVCALCSDGMGFSNALAALACIWLCLHIACVTVTGKKWTEN